MLSKLRLANFDPLFRNVQSANHTNLHVRDKKDKNKTVPNSEQHFCHSHDTNNVSCVHCVCYHQCDIVVSKLIP